MKKRYPLAPHILFTLQRVRLNAQGYTPTGHYYGTGQPIYWAHDDFDGHEWHFRARNRQHAKETIRKVYPDAKFHR